MAATVLLPMPLVSVAAWRFAAKVHPIFRAVQSRLADMTASVQQNVSGIRVVKGFAREPFETDRFGDRAEAVYTESLTARGLRAFYVPGMSFLPATSVALLVFFGGREVVAGTLSLGDFLSFHLFLMQPVWPMRRFGMVIDQGQRALASSDRLFEILHARGAPAGAARGRDPKGAQLAFEDVRFDYGAGEVLDGVDLRVKPGEAIALVGRTGAGKTTLLSLIPRFYDPTGGRVLVGGVPVRELDLEELRRNVGVVPQEKFLFSDCVRNNIAFGNPDATEEEVVRAAKIAGIHEDHGVPPRLRGEGGVVWGITLSGGQKQRVAIARRW